MLIEIKSRWDGHVIFSVEARSLKAAVEIAVKQRADLQSADLRSANLWSTNLQSADLQSADLQSADLQSANLQSTNLQSADLQSADLRSADLRSTNLWSADLRSTDLRSADLQSADLRLARGVNKFLSTPLLFLLDQPGPIRAYKIVTAEGEGIYSRSNGYMPINYLATETFEFPDADTDDAKQCAAGGNLATLDWCMKEWKPGYRILVMEFTAADIAAIPTVTDGKFRVRRCRRVGEKDLKEIGLSVTEEAVDG